MSKLSQETIDKIPALYEKYGTYTGVARELGVAPATVKRYLVKDEDEPKAEISQEKLDWNELYEYIKELFGEVSKKNITLARRYQKKGIGYKAQYMTLKFFYEVEHASIEKSKGSIGIIPHIVARAERYYMNKAKLSDGVAVGVKNQLEQSKIKVNYNPSAARRQKNFIDLNSVLEA